MAIIKRIAWRESVKDLYKGVDIDKVLVELNSINKETLTPEQVVNQARKENSCMHSLFEWNDTIAGEKYRKVQAQKLLGNIAYIVEEDPEERKEPDIKINRRYEPSKRQNYKRYYHNVTYHTNEYHTSEFIISHEDKYDLLKKRAADYLRGAKNRFSDIQELQELWIVIEDCLTKHGL